MNEREILKKLMEDKGCGYTQLKEKLGTKSVSALVDKLNRNYRAEKIQRQINKTEADIAEIERSNPQDEAIAGLRDELKNLEAQLSKAKLSDNGLRVGTFVQILDALDYDLVAQERNPGAEPHNYIISIEKPDKIEE